MFPQTDLGKNQDAVSKIIREYRARNEAPVVECKHESLNPR
jgi:hypothetical protein